ncbi:MAG: class I SAM-dependent methyltransferase, partial [Chloroflexi bacterium]|nr:class I SAM-dependent methyltransferase [Chloroflexota bacterium]
MTSPFSLRMPALRSIILLWQQVSSNKAIGKLGPYRSPKARYGVPRWRPGRGFQRQTISIGWQREDSLDVGCFDGLFTLYVATYFKKIAAIDLSRAALAIARKHGEEARTQNVSFEEQDAYHTSVEDPSFDIVYSRRGPSGFAESFRLLREGGHFIEICIGEKDAQEIKEVFGRGQGFG